MSFVRRKRLITSIYCCAFNLKGSKQCSWFETPKYIRKCESKGHRYYCIDIVSFMIPIVSRSLNNIFEQNSNYTFINVITSRHPVYMSSLFSNISIS